MVHYLLDTNIVSELARPEPNARMRERYRAHEHESAIASVVWHELVYGVEHAPGWPAARRADAVHGGGGAGDVADLVLRQIGRASWRGRG